MHSFTKNFNFLLRNFTLRKTPKTYYLNTQISKDMSQNSIFEKVKSVVRPYMPHFIFFVSLVLVFYFVTRPSYSERPLSTSGYVRIDMPMWKFRQLEHIHVGFVYEKTEDRIVALVKQLGI